jgi:hypothetical protein
MANRRYIDFPIASSVGDSDIILIWQSGANKQTTKATFLSGLPENLDELNDVAISGLTNGQILRYDSVTGKWENTDQGNLDLNDLNDVSIVSPSNGQVLVYNSSTSKWENSSGGFVPYVGAVTTVDLGAQGLRAGYVRFDTSVASVPDEQGLMYWDGSKSTVALIMNGTLQHIGQDTFFYCKNSTGSSIPKGTSVRFAGTDGASGHILITPFLANGSVPSNYFIGVTAEAIANGAFGQVMHFGELDGINTSGYTAGALLYASTTVAGAFQTTVPVAPNNIVLVAAAVNSKNNGAIVVRPTYGSNINTDEGVKITSGATGDLLQLQAGGLWENKTLAQVIGSAYVPTSRTITINGTTQDLSANRTFNVGTVTSVGLSSATSGVTIGSTPITTSGTITLAIATASGSQNGLLSSTDWTTFNSKQNALTNPVTGTGTTNYFPKFTGASTIGNSNIEDDGSSVIINSHLNVNGGDIRFDDERFVYSYAGGSIGQVRSGIYFDGSGLTQRFYINNAEQMRFFSDGNALIQSGGTFTNSGFKLEVKGTGRFLISTSGNALTLFTSSSSGRELNFGFSDGSVLPNAAFYVGNQTAVGVFIGDETTTNGLYVKANGNVGIGTTSPEAILHVNKASAGGEGGYIYIDNPATSTLNSAVGIRFGSSSGASYAGVYTGDISNIVTNAADGASALTFGTFNGSSSGERMRINSLGNVGIATNNPTARLHLKAPTNDQVLRFEQQNDITSQYYFNIDSAVNGALSLVTNYLGGNVVGFCQNRNGNVLIGTTTGGASKLRIVGLPTSSSGLSSGDVWSDSGTLKIA